MHGQSIFGLPSLHSLYSLISKRCYIFDNSMKKNLLNFFKLKLYPYSLNEIFHSILWPQFPFKLKNTLILEIWPPRPFWGHPRPHFKMFSNDSDSIFIQSYCQNDQEIASMSSVQAWPQRLIWRLLRLGLVNDWILRLMHKFHH